MSGPQQLEWAMRWRGMDGGMPCNEIVDGGSPDLGTITFEQDASLSSESSAGVRAKVIMVYSRKLFVFEATKLSELETREVETKAEHLERRWQSLHNPEWDEDLDSDSDVDPELESRLNEAQSQVHANKRLQMPSPKSAASPSVEAPSLEYSPEWAWDVAGAYNIRSELLKETFQLDSGDPVSMHIIYSKNAKGRHMWATFTFGTSVFETMRLAPRIHSWGPARISGRLVVKARNMARTFSQRRSKMVLVISCP